MYKIIDRTNAFGAPAKHYATSEEAHDAVVRIATRYARKGQGGPDLRVVEVTFHDCSNATVTLRTRAFNGALERNQHQVDPKDGSVAVWDDVANHFTYCHSLSAQDVGRVRAAARRALSASGRA